MKQESPTDPLKFRVCLDLGSRGDVIVRRGIAYGSPQSDLSMDIYYPPGSDEEGSMPVVIIVAGYPGKTGQTVTYKDIGWTVSMCELIAQTGIAAIAYTNTEPVKDLQALFSHIKDHALALRINSACIGVLAVSGNVPTALTTILNGAAQHPSCAVFGYGCLLDLDGSTGVAVLAQQFGFVNPVAGRTVADVQRDVPIFISRAGSDQFPAMTSSIDSFVRHGLAANLPITLVNHPNGPHGFDLFDDSRMSRDILRQTLQFLRQHLISQIPNAIRAGD